MGTLFRYGVSHVVIIFGDAQKALRAYWEVMVDWDFESNLIKASIEVDSDLELNFDWDLESKLIEPSIKVDWDLNWDFELDFDWALNESWLSCQLKLIETWIKIDWDFESPLDDVRLGVSGKHSIEYQSLWALHSDI